MAIDYFSKINHSIEFIEKHIQYDIRLEDVALYVELSPYHFHRVFHSILGETITVYIKKRRLSFAAEDLFNTNKRIIEIAVDYGCESQEAFTRAFKHMFGVTPGAFRKNKDQYKPLYELTKRKPFDLKKIIHVGGIHQMEPKFVEKDAFHVVGLQIHSSEANKIPQLWEELDKVVHMIKHRVSETVFLGIIESAVTHFEFTYIAGVEVTKLEDVPNRMVGKTVPTNKYVVFTHKGTTETLQDTFNYIYGTWFPKNGYDRGSGPEFEYYDDDRFFGPMNPNSEIDIYIPIKNKD